jgi:WhiB family redox-sensing transcriptional regulator
MASKTHAQRFGSLVEDAVRDWHPLAACQGSPLFFGPPGERSPDKEMREERAKKVCAFCTVRPDCLKYALRADERAGVWGGYGEDERARLRRRERKAGRLKAEAV